MTAPVELDERVAALRDVFDRAFAAPPAGAAIETDDFILVRVAGDP
jgi:hypothetical protein